jgi:hypothetical protein
MKTRILPLLLVLLPLLPVAPLAAEQGPMGAEEPLAAFDASAPGAAPVTAKNLLENDRFWPYQVELTRAWKRGEGKRTLPEGTQGVLIRVEADGRARVDFGREGIAMLPVDATDVVARANDVRTGKLEKEAPNFTWAVGVRSIDASVSPANVVLISKLLEQRAFLAVYADAVSPEFDALARDLSRYQDRPGLMTIVFHQGDMGDGLLYDRLRRLGWKVPFVVDYMAEAYTSTLIDEGTKLPYVALQSADGRLYYADTWKSGSLPKLDAALAQAGISKAVASAKSAD